MADGGSNFFKEHTQNSQELVDVNILIILVGEGFADQLSDEEVQLFFVLLCASENKLYGFTLKDKAVATLFTMQEGLKDFSVEVDFSIDGSFVELSEL